MLKLDENTLNWSLLHIEKYGDTDIFPVPFEYKAIRDHWDSSIKPFLLSCDILKWNARTHRRCLTPKHRYGFRIATQLDPLDCIVFNTLIGEIGDDIEKARLPKEDNISFSYRFLKNVNGDMFDENYNFAGFQEHSLNLSDSMQYSHVVVADIADFYPRVYSHPLENALDIATTKSSHLSAVKSLLKNWNFTVSIGIPVGITATRLLAELVLDDVDRGLLSESTVHCRYVDDFRIFCPSLKEAHEKLALLANILYENHGLTLQQNKTKILEIDNFKKIYLLSDEKREINSLVLKFREILNNLGIVSEPYEDINYDELDEETQNEIDSMNLVEILEEQILDHENLDISLCRFILRRLIQLGNSEPIDDILLNIDYLYPIFKDIIKYVQDIRSLSPEQKNTVGEKLLDLIEDSISCHLEYHRMWILYTFTLNNEWDNQDRFIKLYNESKDEFTRRKLILALGRANNSSWFKSHKRDVNNYSPWNKRAFIAAASCLPGDEYKHWLRSISSNLDILEKAVGNWASQNKF